MSLYNLVRHESLIPGEEKVRAAIRSVIFIESLKRTNYFSAQCNSDKLEGYVFSNQLTWGGFSFIEKEVSR